MIRPLLSTCMFFACGVPAFAGAPFPCIKAVTSKNGHFLVIAERDVEPNAAGSHQVSLTVRPREDFINEKDKLVAPAIYWTDSPIWSVVPISDPFNEGCPLPLITDDGEFLILLGIGPMFPNNGPAMRIYRRRDHPGDLIKEGPDHGVLVRDVTLTDLWPLDKVRALTNTLWTDESPQWFAGGNIDFTPDNREMIVTSRWGNAVRIQLNDGSLTKK